MQKTKITDIFFDLDHTLWDFEKNSYQAYKKLLKQYNIPVTIDAFEAVYQPVNKQYWQDYAQAKKTKEEVKYGRLTDTFKALKIDIPAPLIIELADVYLDYLKQEKALMPGAIEILEYLKDKYRLHILTNGFQEVQTDKLNHSGLSGYFDKLITSEAIGKQKPHPDVFRYALQQAGCFPHQSYMIGDNLQSDVLGARNIGMFAIHYDPFNESDIDPKIISKVTHLSEIKNFFTL